MIALEFVVEGPDATIDYVFSPKFWLWAAVPLFIPLIFWALELIIGTEKYLKFIAGLAITFFYIFFFGVVFYLFQIFFERLPNFCYNFNRLVPIEYIQYKSVEAIRRFNLAKISLTFRKRYIFEIQFQVRLLHINLFNWLSIIPKLLYALFLFILKWNIAANHAIEDNKKIISDTGRAIIQKIKDLFK